MNEPVADDPEDWNKLVEKAVVIIPKAKHYNSRTFAMAKQYNLPLYCGE
jgi:hypothetical protein